MLETGIKCIASEVEFLIQKLWKEQREVYSTDYILEKVQEQVTKNNKKLYED